MRVALPDGRSVEFTYDGLGRRIQKAVETAGGAASYVAFIYDKGPAPKKLDHLRVEE